MNANGRSVFDDLAEPELWNQKTYWVLANLDPVQRQACVTRLLDPWVTWLVATYRLRMTIPACWYRHPDITERLKNLMVAWIRTFGTDTTDQPLAYVAFDDALERELRRITPPPACLDGDHTDPPITWQTSDDLTTWITTATWATAPATHPTPALTTHQPPEHSMTTHPDQPGEPAMTMTRAAAEALIATGDAQPLRDYAIHYDGTWWLGDQHTYARITDEALNTTLDDRAHRLALADQAVNHVVDRADGEPSPGGAPSGEGPPGEDPSGEPSSGEPEPGAINPGAIEPGEAGSGVSGAGEQPDPGEEPS